MACKVALRPLWDTFAAPSDEYILRQRRIRVPDFDEGELNFAVGKFIDEIRQLPLWLGCQLAQLICPRSLTPSTQDF